MAVTFDGSNDVIDLGSSASLTDIDTQGGGGITISAWINPTSIPASPTAANIFCKADTYILGDWQFFCRKTSINAKPSLSFFRNCAGTDIDVVGKDDLVVLSSWQHVLMTWTGSLTATTVKFYQNGTESSSYTKQQNGTVSVTSDATVNAHIGDSQSSEPFTGGVSEVSVWNSILSSVNISSLYGSGNPTKGTPMNVSPSTLISYWPMDEFTNGATCSGSNTIIDHTSNVNHGTPQNSPVGLTEPLPYSLGIWQPRMSQPLFSRDEMINYA